MKTSASFKDHPTALALVLIVLTGIIAYSNSFGVPFLYDDSTSIVDNPVIRDLGSFLGGEGFRYNPRRFLTYLSLALNYRLGGLDVTGYHLLNLALHLSVAVLVYHLVKVTFRTPRLVRSRLAHHATRIALLSSLLFVAHPMHTEAVTYLVQRTTSLAALFYLLALYLYARGRLGTGTAAAFSYAGALLSVLAAALCKENSATLPLAILLYEASFFVTPWRRRARLIVPLVLMAAAAPFTLLLVRPDGEILSMLDRATRESQVITRTQYLLTQFEVMGTYLRQLFLPYGQNIDHDYPLATSFLSPLVFLSFLLIAGLCALAFLLYRRGDDPADPGRSWLRLIGFGILWFFLTLLVESSLIPIRDVINEHRLYLPSVGIILAASTLLAWLFRDRPRTLLVVAVPMVLTLTLLTWRRNEVWQTPLTLWQDSVLKSPGKARPNHNFAKALSAAGEHERAIIHYQMALRRAGASPETLVELAAEYDAIGQPGRAVEYYRRALSEDARMVPARTRLAILLLKDPATATEGVRLLSETAALAPDNANVHFNLGVALAARGDLSGAEAHYLRAVALDPGYALAHEALGRLYQLKGRTR